MRPWKLLSLIPVAVAAFVFPTHPALAHGELVAVDDVLAVTAGQELTFDRTALIANDLGLADDAELKVIDGPNTGVLTEVGGVFRYQPAAVGDDHLVYELQLHGAPPQTVRATVTLRVLAERVPLAGNWDGLASGELGAYDTETHTFRLCKGALGPTCGNYLGALSCDLYALPFRLTPAMPLVGDWDGDGTDDVGLYDPASSVFTLYRLSTRAGSGLAEIASFAWGAPGSLPVAGDWDGDGFADVGLFEPWSGQFRIPGPLGNEVFQVGIPGDPRQAIAGTWDSGGLPGLGLYDPPTKTFTLFAAGGSLLRELVPELEGNEGLAYAVDGVFVPGEAAVGLYQPVDECFVTFRFEDEAFEDQRYARIEEDPDGDGDGDGQP